ncbi:MAG: bifunctional adenosylcobinamide kinase/adenosylcobinamide-phosphate guanylyltransferase [Deltaproteobacteria bacterium]|nr:bifunctional adenosylcobinamide kinase/adenosylcobinamide-phosphate guanylyltransferase [Deltaproteobacteria bacterium]
MIDHSQKELVLVLGGARSGKSAWAQRQVEKDYRSYLFLATARILDEEMAERVRRHREARGPGWRVIEEPLDIPGVLRKGCGDVDAVLVDCLTVWLGNILVERGEKEVPRFRAELLETLQERDRSIILVSNEVGLGIVPDTPLGRGFRDQAGRLNQEIAAVADKVVFMVAGLPMVLKEGGAPPS